MICSNIYTDKKWRGRGWRGGIMQITEAARVSLCLWLCAIMSPAPHCSRHTRNTTVRGEAALGDGQTLEIISDLGRTEMVAWQDIGEQFFCLF